MTPFEQNMVNYMRSLQLMQSKLEGIYCDLKANFPDTLAIQFAVLNLQEVVLRDFETALGYYERGQLDKIVKSDFPELHTLLADFNIHCDSNKEAD